MELGTLNLIKGGGGNQLREKIVAVASSRLTIVVDEGKPVDRLGAHAKLPVEVAQRGQPFGRPCVILSGGETTVTMGKSASGRGGREGEVSRARGLKRGCSREPRIRRVAGGRGRRL